MVIGFIVGRCFRDLEAMGLLQDLNFSERENERLGEALASALDTIGEMQTDIETLAGKYAEIKTDAS
jgi:hypothetical protein